MKKIIFWIFGILTVILLLTAVVGIIEFNSVDNISLLPGQSIFGQPVSGDLNGDGVPDQAIWLTEQPGGSDTFFYAELLINKNGKFVPTNTLFLGDRIAPQTLEIHDGRVVYNFAERRADEPMTTPPSVGKSVWIIYDEVTNQIKS